MYTNLADSNTTRKLDRLCLVCKVMKQESSLDFGKPMNNYKNAQDHDLPETTTDDQGDGTTVADLPPEVLLHILTFIEPRPRFALSSIP